MKKWKVAFELMRGWQIETIVEASSPIVATEMARNGLSTLFPQWSCVAENAPASCLEVIA